MVAAMGTSGITSFVPRALVAAGLSVIISFAIAYTAMPMMGARFDAVERSYLYRLLNRRSPPTLEAGLRRAIEGGDESDLIVVCGSFRVLEPAHRTLKALQHEHP